MPIRYVLVVPFVLQICASVGLVAYLSYHNGQQAVTEIAMQLQNEICNRIEQHLDNYLKTPQQIHQSNLDAMQLGLIDFYDLENTGEYIGKQMRVFNIGYNKFANPQGEFIGIERLDNGKFLLKQISARNSIGKLYIFHPDNQGKPSPLSEIKNYDPRLKLWYIDAVKKGKPVWSQIDQWEDKPEILAISSSYPVYDRSHKLLGVIGMDLPLSEINNFLTNLQVGHSGRAFILERSGLIVASSTNKLPYTVIKGKAKPLLASDSEDAVVRLTTQYLQKRFGSLELLKGKLQLSFSTKEANYVLLLKNWRDELGLDWLIVVVISQGDFIQQINANTSNSIFLSIATGLVFIQVGILTANCLRKLNRKKIISQEGLAKPIYEKSANVGLTSSTNVEINKTKHSEQLLAQYNHILESQVKKRTQELLKVINLLQNTQKKLVQSQQNAARGQKAAEQANRAKSEFLANMSHELRTPLNAILGFTQVMSNDNSLSYEHQQNLAIINRAGEHLLNLINDILEMSKIEAGRTTLNLSSFDLIRLLRSLEEMLRFRAASAQLQLIFEYAPDLPQYVQTDEGKLRQVLLNLLGNAIKFTLAGSVTLRVSMGNGEMERWENEENKSLHHPSTPTARLYFEILDTGPGIAPQEISLLFQAFGQTEIGRKSQQGTGLGLAISRKYIQLMGGDIGVTSTLGVGSQFAFDIQIGLASASQIHTDQNQTHIIGLAPTQRECRILVVDDAKESRLIVGKILKSIGLEVREASNGEEAIAQWLEWQPHLIFMDIRMPVMDGYEAIKVIKAREIDKEIDSVKPAPYHIPTCPIIIALTASAFEEERQKILSTGGDDFIRKPFTQQLLLEKVREHLGVEYITQIENKNIISANQQTQKLPQEADVLQTLSQMPPEWLKQVRHAAASCSDGMILELLEQIPADQSQLLQLLRDLANNYQFEKIMELTTSNLE